MYDVEATVTETSPTVLKLTADWPVDWLRETGTRTMEIQRELLPGEILDLPSVRTERAEINGDRGNWRKLRVGNRVLVRCFFPGKEPTLRLTKSIRFASASRTFLGAGGTNCLSSGPTGLIRVARVARWGSGCFWADLYWFQSGPGSHTH